MSHVIWRNRVWFDPLPGPTKEAIEYLESAVGATLPTSFKEFLGVANGAQIDYAVTLSPGGAPEEDAVFSDWYRAGEPGDESAGTLLGELQRLELAWFREYLPERYLPIARTGVEDDTLLFDLTAKGHGTVLAWISGLPPAWGSRTENVIHAVAATFDDFISRLFISDELVELAWPPPQHASAEGIADLEAWLDHGRPSWRNRK